MERFSIVVPTWNRPRELAACLDALARLDEPRERFEVVVVDDGGERSPAPLVASARDRLDVRLVEVAHGGPGAARNAGARDARGRWLAFTDDDCRPRPDWLRGLAAALSADPESAVGGRVVNALPANRFSTASQLLVTYLYDSFAAGKTPTERFFSTANLALSRERFLDLGGFDAGFLGKTGEDRDLCGRWLHAGRTLAYAPDAVVEHAHELGWVSFWRQHFDYGRGALHVNRARKRRGGGEARVDPRFYRDLVTAPFATTRQGSVTERAIVSGLLAVSQVAYVSGLVREAACESFDWRRRDHRATVCDRTV